ncbi:hypothetical protein C8R43DRAFT_943807 [Mycena crocata]|nr:hypothetical protein C8R43DRAFT_943807 [Mycena crocata]
MTSYRPFRPLIRSFPRPLEENECNRSAQLNGHEFWELRTSILCRKVQNYPEFEIAADTQPNTGRLQTTLLLPLCKKQITATTDKIPPITTRKTKLPILRLPALLHAPSTPHFPLITRFIAISNPAYHAAGFSLSVLESVVNNFLSDPLGDDINDKAPEDKEKEVANNRRREREAGPEGNSPAKKFELGDKYSEGGVGILPLRILWYMFWWFFYFICYNGWLLTHNLFCENNGDIREIEPVSEVHACGSKRLVVIYVDLRTFKKAGIPVYPLKRKCMQPVLTRSARNKGLALEKQGVENAPGGYSLFEIRIHSRNDEYNVFHQVPVPVPHLLLTSVVTRHCRSSGRSYSRKSRRPASTHSYPLTAHLRRPLLRHCILFPSATIFLGSLVFYKVALSAF